MNRKKKEANTNCLSGVGYSELGWLICIEVHLIILRTISVADLSPFEQYKTLEAMVNEVQSNSSNLASTAPTLDKTERSSTRIRGSSSPFRCISSLVQQMNVEKDQELSIARLHVEELEALVASRQKEAIIYLVLNYRYQFQMLFLISSFILISLPNKFIHMLGIYVVIKLISSQVCMLNTRLAAAESMTHDVIRDLLGVKLDMTNYAVSFKHLS